jgi:hypothetical protein
MNKELIVILGAMATATALAIIIADVEKQRIMREAKP